MDHSRFIINCPKEEFQSFERLFFQIEQVYSRTLTCTLHPPIIPRDLTAFLPRSLA